MFSKQALTALHRYRDVKFSPPGSLVFLRLVGQVGQVRLVRPVGLVSPPH